MQRTDVKNNGIYLKYHIFTDGQLYVAVSQIQHYMNLSFVQKKNNMQSKLKKIENIIFKRNFRLNKCNNEII